MGTQLLQFPGRPVLRAGGQAGPGLRAAGACAIHRSQRNCSGVSWRRSAAGGARNTEHQPRERPPRKQRCQRMTSRWWERQGLQR